MATSALTTAIMPNVTPFGTGDGILTLAGNAAARSVVSQGINILTGQQQGFSWASVAASAIAAPIANRVNSSLFGNATTPGPLSSWANKYPDAALLVQKTTTELVSATTRVAIVGGKLDWTSIAADALSSFAQQKVTNYFANALTTATQPKDQLAQEEVQTKLGVADAETPSRTMSVDEFMSNWTPARDDSAASDPYTVQEGDNLSRISRRTGISVGQLALWNNMKNSLLQPGQVLITSGEASSARDLARTEAMLYGQDNARAAARAQMSAQQATLASLLSSDGYGQAPTWFGSSKPSSGIGQTFSDLNNDLIASYDQRFQTSSKDTGYYLSAYTPETTSERNWRETQETIARFRENPHGQLVTAADVANPLNSLRGAYDVGQGIGALTQGNYLDALGFAVLGGIELRGGPLGRLERSGVNATNSAAPVRPTWRQSEIDIGTQLEGQGYKPQISFKDGVEVPYGTKGSVRPEYYREGSSVEVKNYNVETAAGSARLERNVVGQAIQRADNLPSGTAQSLTIDVRGQNVTRAQLNQMLANIERKSGGAITRDNINILR